MKYIIEYIRHSDIECGAPEIYVRHCEAANENEVLDRVSALDPDDDIVVVNTSTEEEYLAFSRGIVNDPAAALEQLQE